jgi:hypothetical protein
MGRPEVLHSREHMSKHPAEDHTVPVACRHCSSVTLQITVRAGSWVKPCAACGRDTVIRVERRLGRWEIYTGLIPGGRR